MADHKIRIYIPENWSPHSKQFGWDAGYPPCTKYTLITPDGNGVLTINTYCGGFGGATLWQPCGSNSQFVDYDRQAVRVQDGDITFEYMTGSWGVGEQSNTMMCRWGWLGLPWIFDVHYSQANYQFDFETVDKILLSMKSYE